MQSSENSRRTDTVSRVIHASPSAIYRAYINPTALVSWLPPAGMKGQIHEFEPHAGGTYRMSLTYSADTPNQQGKTSDNTDVVHGRFLELVPDERIVQLVDFESDDPQFAGTMSMAWNLHAVPEGTLVTIVCENVPEGISQADHLLGMQQSLEQLATFTEQ